MSDSWGSSDEPALDEAATLVVQTERPDGVRLYGELDLASLPEVWARLEGADGDVELDCAGLTFIDAAGLRLFVSVQAACQARGAKLSIVSPSRCVVRLLELTGFDAVFDVRAESSAP
jgi:anti-sigma B factor antagonist